MGSMNPLLVNANAAVTVTGSLKLPGSGHTPVPAPRPEQSETSPLAQWLLQTAQTSASQPTGVADLLRLLATVQSLFPQAMPELLIPLQHRLQPYVLGTRQLSDASRIRQLILHCGLFLENNLATGGGVDTLVDDLKLQLFQILTLMDPSRQLLLQNGLPAFINANSTSARALQGNAVTTKEYGSKPLRSGKQLQAYLQCSHEDAQGGVSDGMLNQWLQQQVEDVLKQLVQQQLHSQRQGDDSCWQLELLLQQGESVQGLPLTIREHGEGAAASWNLQFRLQLPGLGAVKIEMTLEGKQVNLVYCNNNVLSVATRQRHAQQLQAAFAGKQLALTGLSHRLVE